MTYTQQNLALTVSSPLGKDSLIMETIDGHEELSGSFQYTLEMKSEDPNLSFQSIVGKTMCVSIDLGEGQTRYIHGIVGKFIQGMTDQRFTRYRAEVHPWLWLLTMTRDCRVFQNQTVPQILQTVFKDAGYTDFRFSLKSTYKPKDYCVQYQESAFDFVSRLMEDEGIFYFFEFQKDRHTLVIADDRDVHPSCPGSHILRYRGAQTSRAQGDAITRCTFEQQVIPGGYMMDDFNFETPNTNLLVKAKGSDETRKLYEYPGGYPKTSQGEDRANRRLEAFELPEIQLRGESTCRALTACHKFTLKDYDDRPAVNGSYVLKRVTTTASQDVYRNSFEAFPVNAPYRPTRDTPKPKIVGAQTAFVVGKANEEIWTDKYGRVKVQFHWDQRGTRNEKSSCWVRVAQGWAGKQWGMQFIPRIGQEVVVSFLEGDPDRPIITGCVYNAQSMPPYTLPAHHTQSGIRTRSTQKGKVDEWNEIRFEDKKGAEEVYMQAQKDMKVHVKHNRVKEVLNDETITIKKNRRTTIEEEDELLVVSKGNRMVHVKKGEETHTVEGARSVKVKGEETHTNGGDFTQKVGKNHVLKVDGNLTIDVSGSVTIKSGLSIKNQAGTSLTNLAGTSMKNEAKISLVNKGGASQTVEGGGILTVKGGLVKIN